MKKLLILLLMGVSGLAMAEEQRADSMVVSLGQLDMYQMQNRWGFAAASTQAANSWYNFGWLQVGTQWANGAYHRTQEAKSSTHVDAKAQGGVMLGKYRVFGSIDLRQHWNRGVNYALMMEPLRDMPYQLADSTGGDWKQQQYQLQARIISPLYGKHFSWAADMKLEVGRGAKNTDPRPQDNTNRIEATPSITWHNRVLQTSLYGGYYRTRERTELMLYNSSEPQKLYLMKGLGQYTWQVMSTSDYERQFKGDGWHGGVQLGHRWKRHSMLLGIDVGNGIEDVYDMVDNSPRHIGRAYNTSARLDLNWQIWRKRSHHEISYTVDNTSTSGREYIQVFNSSADVNRWETLAEAPARYISSGQTVLLGYQCYLHREGEKDYRWKFGVQAGNVSCIEEYEAMSALRHTEHALVNAHLAHRFACGRKLTATVGVDVTLKQAMEDYQEYEYTPRETEDTHIGDMMQSDWDYLSASYYRYSGTGRLEWQCLPTSQLYLQVKGGGLTTSSQHLHRRQVQVAVGYLF